MSDKYNKQLAQIGALINATSSEIANDTSLKTGEKFLLLQRIFVDLKPTEKNFKNLEKEIKEFALASLHDVGNNQSEPAEYEGAEVMIKYSYPKPGLNAEKLKEDLQRAFAEIGTDFNELDYFMESTPRKKVIIQSILQK